MSFEPTPAGFMVLRKPACVSMIRTRIRAKDKLQSDSLLYDKPLYNTLQRPSESRCHLHKTNILMQKL